MGWHWPAEARAERTCCPSAPVPTRISTEQLGSTAAVGNVSICNSPFNGTTKVGISLYPFAQFSLSYASVSVRLCKISELLVWPLYTWVISLVYISLTSSNTWENFLSSVILEFSLHFYKKTERWLWKLILPKFLWVVNSHGYQFGIDLVY